VDVFLVFSFFMKTVLVTGGTRGIGRAIVHAFIQNDYFVFFTYYKNEKLALAIEEEYSRGRVHGIRCSLTDDEDIQSLINSVKEKNKKPDVIVNNAGITADNYFAMMSMGNFEKVVQTNLMGTVKVTKAMIKDMISRQSGVIINISSISGLSGAEGQTNYAAAKAGIIGFSKSLAREVGKYNIRVVVVAPGFIRTDMYAKIPIPLKKKQLEGIALQRPGETHEIAELVVFLASEKASYITGNVITVDGGMI
jgi:3-oxoacyl-[acyl-carrier protein] reductase